MNTEIAIYLENGIADTEDVSPGALRLKPAHPYRSASRRPGRPKPEERQP